jgi:methionyl-tRNA synthetase
MDPLVVTTAIPYVNARPHLGFALEAVLADAVARHARLRGREVRFVTGTDENSLKNAIAAEREGAEVGRFVEEHASEFARLVPLLDLSVDAFVRTSVDRDHRAVVESLWRASSADLFRSRYRGLYCVGCEAFLDRDRCEEHDAPPEPVDEENWFFRAGRHAPAIRRAIESGALEVVPDVYARESLAWLDSLGDVSVSRDARRARGVGIPVPDDPSQVIYVWFDALAAYLSGAPGAGDRLHVVGKGIVRFHTVLWPAILLSAGLPLPKKVAVHGYLTLEGKKISKSGTGLDPFEVVPRHGVEAIRHFLLRHVRTARDGDVREERILAAYEADLANGLGNLVQRTLGLVDRRPPSWGELDALDRALLDEADRLPERIDDAIARFAVDEATGAIFELVAASNRYVDRTAPWKSPRAQTIVAVLVRTLRTIAHELTPFLPSTARAIVARLDGTERTPLFPRRVSAS